jgi:hypothetical protein
VKRSIEFPCDPRWIKNPTNKPIATIGQRMAASARTKKAIAAVQAILSAHFRRPPMTCAAEGEISGRLLDPNHWTVRLTRISPGTLDPLTGGASMKTIQDAVARWCGVPDERNPIWTWVEPIGQEKRGQGVYGVRIEIESLEPGQDRIVRLKGVEAREPKVKRGRPTVGDLRTAAERAFNRAGVSKESRERIMSDAAKLQADPGEERAACMLRGCETCGVLVGVPCREEVPGARAFGAHVVRARAAGVLGVQLELPKRAPRGPRKLATVRPVECWARLPWGKPCGACKGRPSADVEIEGQVLPGLCGDCDGLGVRVVRWKAAEEKGAPGEVVMEIAPDHKAAWRTMCKACVGQGCNTCGRVGRTHKFRMIRRPWRRAGVDCWLYEPAT